METNQIARFREAVTKMCPADNATSPPKELIQLVEAEIERCPTSAYLQCLLGDIVEMGGITSDGIDDGAVFYERALKIDPYCADAYESLAFHASLHEEAANTSMELFEVALSIEQRMQSYIGLIEVLCELQQTEYIVAVIQDASDFLHKLEERFSSAVKECNLEPPDKTDVGRI